MADIKTINAVPVASIKTYQGIPLADVKTINALEIGAATGPVSPIPTEGLGVWYQADQGVLSQYAAQFVYTNAEHFSMPTTPSVRFGAIPWTVGGWVWFDSLGIMVMATRCSGALEMEWQIYSNSTILVANTWNGTTHPQIQISGACSAGVWQFYIISYDPAGGGVVTLQANNGTPVSGVVGATTDHAGGGIMLGANTWGTPGALMNGRQQNWFMFGRALNATERTFLYNSGAGRRYEELDTTFKADLRAWWPLDELSGSRRDLSGNGNTLTDNNTVTYTTGNVLNQAGANGQQITVWGDSGPGNLPLSRHNPVGAPAWWGNQQNGNPILRFDGADRRMKTVPTAGSVLAGPQQQTVFVVQKQVAAPGDTTYSWDSSGTFTNELAAHLKHTNNYLYHVLGAAGAPANGLTYGTAPEPWLGLWHKIELYRDGASAWILTDDVTLPIIQYPTGTFNPAPSVPLFVGARLAAGPAEHFTGDLGELIIYNRALSAPERDIVRAYLQEKWFKFNPASIAGLRTWYEPGTEIYSRSAAQFVKANSEYLSIPSNTSLRFGNIPWSIGGWFYADSLGTNIMLSKSVSTSTFDYLIYILAGGEVVAQSSSGATTPYATTPAGVATVGTWQFVVASFDPSGGGILSVQVNNGTIFTSAATGVLNDSSTDSLLLGAWPSTAPGSFWSGRLQNWFMFGRALNATERSFLYNSGNGRSYEELDAAFKTDLRAWWPLDEQSGTRRDKHTNANHLTDVNTVTVADGVVLNVPSNNSLVYQWKDQGPAGLHLSQGNPGLRPHYHAVIRDGLPALRFFSHNLHKAGVTTAELPVGPLNGDVFIVYYVVSPPAIKNLYQWSSNVANTFGILATFSDSNTYSDWGTYNGGDREYGPVPAGFFDNWHLIESWRNGNTAGEFKVDNTMIQAIVMTGDGIDAGTANFVLGAGSDFTYGIDGYIAECLFYNTPLSPADRAAVRAYLSTKYGLGL